MGSLHIFASKTYSNFQQFDNINYGNAEKKYLEYLQLAKQLAIDLETQGENIELFLFTFGNNLKQQND